MRFLGTPRLYRKGDSVGRHSDQNKNGIADYAESHPYRADTDAATTARGLTANASVDTQWADVSYYQSVVTDAYPYRVLAIRSNDGTYKDPRFAANYAWALDAMNRGRLDILIVYTVYRTNWSQTASIHTSMLGTSHPGVVSMIDVESWSGAISGNQSAGINGMVAQIAAFHGGNRLRVIGYGNTGDLNSLWPQKPAGMRLVVAAYGSNPSYPGKVAHQYSDSVVTAPFGACDINSADGMSVADLQAAFGLTAVPAPVADVSAHRRRALLLLD